MSTDYIKLGHLFAEIVSSHDVSRFDEIVAPCYLNHNPFAEPGPEGVKKVFGAIIAGVPDYKVFAEDVFVSADGTRVVGRYRYEGTHTGNFLGYAATGNAFAMRSIDIWLVKDGRFVEHWDELNTLGHLQPGRRRAAAWPAVVTKPIQQPTRRGANFHADRQTHRSSASDRARHRDDRGGGGQLRRSSIGPRPLRAGVIRPAFIG